MVAFECARCGKCCQSFGEFIKIVRQVSQRDYYCRFGITGEVFQVHVRPEFSDEIDEDHLSDEAPEMGPARGCIFLRKDHVGRSYTCAIYPTWPPICRDFRCFRMLIYRNGTLMGRVMSSGELKTDDAWLRTLWEEKISNLPVSKYEPEQQGKGAGRAGLGNTIMNNLVRPVKEEWFKKIISLLSEHGYACDLVT